jgi:hypothetical protein
MDRVDFVIFSSGANILSNVIEQNKIYLKVIEINPLINSIPLRFLRMLSLKTGIFNSYWFRRQIRMYSHQLSKIHSCTNIIVFDCPIWICNAQEFSKTFCQKNTKFWFWNPVKRRNHIKLIRQGFNHVYSFDPNDCLKYELKFIPQFNIPQSDNILEGKTEIFKYDLFFIGRAKSRLKEIEFFYKQISTLNLDFFFHVKKDKLFQVSNIIDLKKSYISYDEYSTIQKQSKAIVEFNSKEQSGLSLRAIQAIFSNKKLITNNSYIKNYNFYREENILIWENGKTKSDSIIKFLNIQIVELDKELKDQYSFKSWINSF